MIRGDRLAIVLYIGAALATGFVDLRVRPYPDYAFKTYIPGVIDGTYGPPAIYRILVPYALDWMARTFGVGADTIWYASRLVLCAAAYIAFHWYLRTWHPPVVAAAGTLLTAALLPLTFTNSWAHPDHFGELLLFTLGCAAIAKGRDGLFALVLPLAALNRETAVFLVMLYAVSRPLTREHVLRTAGFGAVWLLVFTGLRVWRGVEHYEYWQLARNLEFLKLLPPPRDPYYRAYAWFGAALAGPLLWVALRGSSTQRPLFVRRALWVVPAFIAVAFTISSIIESRIFTPLFPLIVPATISSLVEGDPALAASA